MDALLLCFIGASAVGQGIGYLIGKRRGREQERAARAQLSDIAAEVLLAELDDQRDRLSGRKPGHYNPALQHSIEHVLRCCFGVTGHGTYDIGPTRRRGEKGGDHG
jgi:hypothetical protein